MKKLLVLLLSLMLMTSILALGEELSNPIENPTENPTNNLVLPVEPPEPQINEPNLGEPMNPPPQPENQPQPPQAQPPMGNPGQPQNNFNKDKPMPPNVGNQPGKYLPPKDQFTGGVIVDKEENQQEMLPPLDENEENDQPQEIPEADGSWVPLKKIGNLFYFWKPKDTPKEQFGNLQNPPKGLGNIKNGPKLFPPEKLQDGTEQNQEGNRDIGNGDQDFQDNYEKDKANTNVDVKSFKNPGEADAAFEQAFKEGNMEIVLVKNMKLVKRTTGEMDEYLWPAHDKIISLSVPEGNSLEQNLLAFEYLGKYPSKLKLQGDTLGLPSEGMKNLPPLEETPQFKEGGFQEEKQQNSFGAETPGKSNNNSPPPGCKVSKDKGVPTGFRLINEDSPEYCDWDNQLHPQKELDESCQNNFECQSNQCSSGKCLDLSAKLEETQGLLQRILTWLGQKE